MNITKYMCKKFDRYDKGYVTIRDIIDVVLSNLVDIIIILIAIISIVSTIVFVLNLLGNLYYTVLDSNHLNTEFSIRCIATGLFMLLLAIVIIYGVSYLLEKLGNIKIFKCPLKEEK